MDNLKEAMVVIESLFWVNLSLRKNNVWPESNRHRKRFLSLETPASPVLLRSQEEGV
jgi:hypothetical protein